MMNASRLRMPPTILDRAAQLMAAIGGVVAALSAAGVLADSLVIVVTWATGGMLALLFATFFFDRALRRRFFAVNAELLRQRIEWDSEWSFLGERTGGPVSIALRNVLVLETIALMLLRAEPAVGAAGFGLALTLTVFMRQAKPTCEGEEAKGA